MIDLPDVSVVIPTRNRPDWLLRAVRSALSQTFRTLEVIVVIDGPDIATAQVLARLDDPRLRVVQLASNVGGSDARNIGVQVARGEWTALLDDDDEWLPTKIEKQVAVATGSAHAEPIVASQILERNDGFDVLRPLEPPHEPLSEYLFCRSSLTAREGVLQTSTLLARRSLFLSIPLQSGLRKHQDWDWLLRAMNHPGVGIEFVPEPLAIWNGEPGSVSHSANWKMSLAWVRSRRYLLTRRAYACFLTVHVAWQAAEQQQWAAFLPLLTEAFRNGSPRPSDVVRYLAFWFVSPRTRRQIRRLLRR